MSNRKEMTKMDPKRLIEWTEYTPWEGVDFTKRADLVVLNLDGVDLDGVESFGGEC